MLIQEKLDGTLEYLTLVNNRGRSYGTVDHREDTRREAKTKGRNQGSTSTSSTTSSVGDPT